jgi:glycine cleavage system aminomethyltransferase T/Flp pilus assembly CpaE family ATPase
LDSVVANDVAALEPGRSHYTHFLDPEANVLDDAMVYRRGETTYLVVVNAANDEKLWSWLSSVRVGEVRIDTDRPWTRVYGRGCVLRDLRHPEAGDAMRVDIALQGRASREILLALGCSSEDRAALEALPWAGLMEGTFGGFELIVSRTGYTGERVAYELFVHPDVSVELWNRLLEAGEPLGLKPAGLGARDSLRTEAGLPLYGQELAGEMNLGVGDAGFAAYVKTYKPWFIGRSAFLRQEQGRTKVVARFRFSEPRVRMAHYGDLVADEGGEIIGRVTSCAIDRKRHLTGQAYLPLEVMASVGTKQCLQRVSDFSPDIVLFVEEDAQVSASEVSREIYQQHPGTAIIVLTSPERQDSANYLRQALLIGARDVLPMPPMLDTLVSSIQQAHLLEKGRRPARAVRGYRVEAKGVGGQLIVVYSPKGGVGRSVVAANLAAFLARQNKHLRVTILDLDLQFGDQRILLNLETNNSFLDLLPVIDELTRDVVDSTLVPHPSGLRVLPAPQELPQADLIDAESVRKVLVALRAFEDIVIIDAPPAVTDISLTAFEFADRILTICTPDVLTIRRTRAALELFDGLGIPRHLVSLVLNRASKQCEIKPDEFFMLFEHEIMAEIPADFFLLEPYVNIGTLLTEAPKSASLVGVFEELAQKLAPTAVSAEAPQPA